MVSRSASERLIRYGFLSETGAKLMGSKSGTELDMALKEISDSAIVKYADHEIAEEAQFQVLMTPFHKPIKRFRLWWENFNLGVEEAYFWVLDYMRNRLGFPYVVKTEDVFSAAENSAFFGASQQRIGLQQDKVSQFLATIGKMVKELFQLVREMRIIDERLSYY